MLARSIFAVHYNIYFRAVMGFTSAVGQVCVCICFGLSAYGTHLSWRRSRTDGISSDSPLMDSNLDYLYFILQPACHTVLICNLMIRDDGVMMIR
jgi:hypothetical protein